MSALKQTIVSLPYFRDSAPLFAPMATEPWSVFLDSGFPESQQGHYDIIVADPVCTLLTHGAVTTVTRNGISVNSEEDPFKLVKRELKNDRPAFAGFPFSGGAIGYFAYDLARRLEKLPVLCADDEHIAEMAVGIYDWAVIVDHRQRKSHLVGMISDPLCRKLVKKFRQNLNQQSEFNFQVTGAVNSSMDKVTYDQAFCRIKNYLKEGDCYQVNLAQRFCAPCQGDSWAAYIKLRAMNSAPFCCYMKTPEVEILSSSPERFLKVREGIVETKPIKGTRPRKTAEADDRLQQDELINSEKDRAENVMIVDLLRNDISKSCEKGSVKVPRLFEIESYATVHHLVSTVTGKLAHDQHPLDLLKNCFPGGSITGAPKIRAMEIIEELELYRRGVYCGSVGYIGYDGNMDTNIAIRTLVHVNDTIRFWAGGGIVNDSTMEEEYQESFDKAAALLNVLQQMRS